MCCPFKSCLGQDAVNKLIIKVVQGNKCCCVMVKDHFNKELVMNKKDKENFQSSAKCWIWDNTIAENDVKVRGHCHVKWKI